MHLCSRCCSIFLGSIYDVLPVVCFLLAYTLPRAGKLAIVIPLVSCVVLLPSKAGDDHRTFQEWRHMFYFYHIPTLFEQKMLTGIFI